MHPLAVQEEEKLPWPLTQAIAGLSSGDRMEILASYRRSTGEARRIDFLFGMSFMSMACLRQELFGLQKSMSGLTGSDHYGVLNIYTYHRMPC
jgi:hypothetical protein